MSETSAPPRPPPQHRLPAHQSSRSAPTPRSQPVNIDPSHMFVNAHPYSNGYVTKPYVDDMYGRPVYPQPPYIPQEWVVTHGSSPAVPSDQAYSPSVFNSVPPHINGFSHYPQPYPSHSNYVVYPGPQALPTPAYSPPLQPAIPDSAEPPFDSENDEEEAEEGEQASPVKALAKPPPRPPNAWILYRSDRLKDIAEKKPLPTLDAVMAEAGLTSGRADSPETEANGTGKKKKVPKPKKGSKTPSEGMLSLGKGKTGRGIPQADVSKLISMMWQRETPDIKKYYERQSELQKLEHQRTYPDYKFQPIRKADKLRMREERERAKAEAKRLQELEKQAGRAKRKGRSKLSPVSPYNSGRGARVAALAPGEAEHKYGASPFPFPQESLPALRMDRMGIPLMPIPDAAPPPSLAAPAVLATSAPAADPAPISSHAAMHAAHAHGAVPPAPDWDAAAPMNPAYAIPYIFEPIPLDGELSFDNIGPLHSPDDPDALAAMWCTIEEEPQQVGPSSEATWQYPAADAPNAWEMFANLPGTPHAFEVSESFIQQLGTEYGEIPYGQLIYDPSLSYIQVPLPYPQVEASSSAAMPPGTFLPNQPLSPLEPWTQVSTVPEADRVVSSASTSALPRHVSASSFPATPLSVHTAGWSDRTTSFSALASQLVHDGETRWEDEPDHSFEKVTKPSAPSFTATTPTTSAAPGSAEGDQSTSISGTSSDSSRGPPRNIHRPRMVGQAFAEPAVAGG